MADTPVIEVERLGGFAGFGLPGARIRSRGRLALSSLSVDERLALDKHLQLPSSVVRAPVTDGFRYRLTWHTGKDLKTLELPESLVPPALRDCVSDELI